MQTGEARPETEINSKCKIYGEKHSEANRNKIKWHLFRIQIKGIAMMLPTWNGKLILHIHVDVRPFYLLL